MARKNKSSKKPKNPKKLKNPVSSQDNIPSSEKNSRKTNISSSEIKTILTQLEAIKPTDILSTYNIKFIKEELCKLYKNVNLNLEEKKLINDALANVPDSGKLSSENKKIIKNTLDNLGENDQLSSEDITSIKKIYGKALNSLSSADIKFIMDTLHQLEKGELDKLRLLIRETHEIIKCLSKMEFENFNYPLAYFFDQELNSLVRYLNSENVLNAQKVNMEVYNQKINKAFQCSIDLLQEYLSFPKEKIISRPGSLIIDLTTAFKSFTTFFLSDYSVKIEPYLILENVDIKHQSIRVAFNHFKSEFNASIAKFEALSLPISTPVFVKYDCQEIMHYIEENIAKEIPAGFKGNWQEYIINTQKNGNFAPQQTAAKIIINKTIKLVRDNNDFYKTGFLKKELPELFNKLIGDKNIYFYQNVTEISSLLYSSINYIDKISLIFMISEYYSVFANASYKASRSNQDLAHIIKNEKKLQSFFYQTMNGPFPEINTDHRSSWKDFPLAYIDYLKNQIVSFFKVFANNSGKPLEFDLKNKSLSELSYLVIKQALTAIYQQKNPDLEQTEVNFYTFSYCAANLVRLSELENNLNLEKEIKKPVLESEAEEFSELIDFLAYKLNIVPEVHIKDLTLNLTITGLKIASTAEIIDKSQNAPALYGYITDILATVYEIISHKYGDSLDIRVHLIPLITKLLDCSNNKDKPELIYAELLKLTKEYLNDEGAIIDLSNHINWFDLIFEIIADNVYLHDPENIKIQSCQLLLKSYERHLEKIISLNIKEENHEDILNKTLLISKKIPDYFNGLFIDKNKLIKQKIKACNWIKNESDNCWRQINKYKDYNNIVEIIDPLHARFVKEFYKEKNPFIEEEYEKLSYYQKFFSSRIEVVNPDEVKLDNFYKICCGIYTAKQEKYPLRNVITSYFSRLRENLENIFEDNTHWERHQFDLFLMMYSTFLETNNELFYRSSSELKKLLDSERKNVLEYISILQVLSEKIKETCKKYNKTIPDNLIKQIAKLGQSKTSIESIITLIEKKKESGSQLQQHQKNTDSKEGTSEKGMIKKITSIEEKPVPGSQLKKHQKTAPKEDISEKLVIESKKTSIEKKKIPVSQSQQYKKNIAPVAGSFTNTSGQEYKKRKPTFFNSTKVESVIKAADKGTIVGAKNSFTGNEKKQQPRRDSKVSESTIVMDALHKEGQPSQQPKSLEMARSYRDALLFNISKEEDVLNSENNATNKIIAYEPVPLAFFHEVRRELHPLQQDIIHLSNCYNYLSGKINFIKHSLIFKLLLDLMEMFYKDIDFHLTHLIGEINRGNSLPLKEFYAEFVPQFNEMTKQQNLLPNQEGESDPLATELYFIIREINIKQSNYLQIRLNKLFTYFCESDDMVLYASIKTLVGCPVDANNIDIPLNYYDLNFHLLNSIVLEHYRFLVYIINCYPEQIERNDLESFSNNVFHQHECIKKDYFMNRSHRWQFLEIQFNYFKAILEIIAQAYSLNSYLSSGLKEQFPRDLEECLNKSLVAKNNLMEYYDKIKVCEDIRESLSGCTVLSLASMMGLLDTLQNSIKTYLPAQPQRIEELEDIDCQTGLKL